MHDMLPGFLATRLLWPSCHKPNDWIDTQLVHTQYRTMRFHAGYDPLGTDLSVNTAVQ